MLYRLADLELSFTDSMHEGLETISRALETEPNHGRAAQSIKKALELAPEDERVVGAYEKVARSAGDRPLLLDALERRGRIGDTVIVVVSDHGDSLGEHAALGHEYSLYDTLLHVPLMIRYAERTGLVHDAVSEVTSVVSPLALEPKVPKAGRYIFGAVADRLVSADHVRDLWRHWDEPEMVWYQGGHCTFQAHGAVQRMVHRAFADAGLIS